MQLTLLVPNSWEVPGEVLGLVQAVKYLLHPNLLQLEPEEVPRSLAVRRRPMDHPKGHSVAGQDVPVQPAVGLARPDPMGRQLDSRVLQQVVSLPKDLLLTVAQQLQQQQQRQEPLPRDLLHLDLSLLVSGHLSRPKDQHSLEVLVH